MLDLNSEAQAQAFSTAPLSRLPRIWVGFLFAFAFFVAEIVLLMRGYTGGFSLVLTAIALSAWGYWLFCVHRFHKILEEFARMPGAPAYPVTPGEAVGQHFIPVYNFFWTVKWPMEMTQYLKEQASVEMIPGVFLGIAVLVSLVLRMVVDGFLGLTLMYCVGWYISRKLRRVMAERTSLQGSLDVFS